MRLKIKGFKENEKIGDNRVNGTTTGIFAEWPASNLLLIKRSSQSQ